jgi:hypothetical protein
VGGAAVTLLALGALVLAPALGSLAPPPEIHDLLEYFYPVYQAFYGGVRTGAPLLWNPYQLCGVPWVGTLLPGFFYPPHAAYLVLPVGAGVTLTSLAHLGLIAVGTAVFVRRAGLSTAAGMLAALVFTLSGTVRDWQRWPYHLEAGAWLPLGAVGVLGLAEGTRRGGLLLAIALGASWLAGSPQVTIFLLYAWTALLIAFASRHGVAGTVARYGGALVLGTLLAAVALLPAIHLAPLTVRQAEPLSLGAMYPWGIPSPASLLHTLVAGRPLALGIAAVALAPLALAHRGQRRLALWALIFGLLATALALSPLTPVFDLYRALPGLAWFRGPNRLLFLSQFCLAVLAAVGFDAVVSRRAATGALAALVGVALVDMTLVAGAPPPVPNAGVAGAWSPALEDAYRRLAATTGSERVWTLGDHSPALLPPKLPTVAHLRSAGDYEPGALRRQAEYFTYLLEGALDRDSPVPFEGRVFSLTPPPGRAPAASRRRLLDLAAVRFIVVPAAAQANADVSAFLRDAGLEPDRLLLPGVRLATNARVQPRAFVTYRAEPAPPTEELLRRMSDPLFDPLASSFVEGEVPDDGDRAPVRGGPVAFVRDEPHVVELDADLPAPGLVVLADTFDPDWVAFVDGVVAPIVPTNHLFRGVWAPAGRHRVRFVYRPAALWAGAAVSLVALLALGVAAVRLGPSQSDGLTPAGRARAPRSR